MIFLLYNQSIMDNINQYIEQMLTDKGVTDIEEPVRKQLVNDLSQRLVDFINKRLIDSMPDEDVKTLSSLLDENPQDTQKIQSLIDSKVPEKETVAASAMVEFRTMYLGAN
jgi:hypothetical protein